MHAPLIRTALLLTGVSSAAMASGVGTTDLNAVGTRVATTVQQWTAPPPPAPSDPVGYAVDQWKRLMQSDDRRNPRPDL